MTPALRATDLVAGYRRGRRVSPIVTVDHAAAWPGRLVAVIGPNGAGKSTLLRTLVGTQPPLAGEVEVAGAPLRTLDRKERARRVAVVLTDRVDAGLLSVGDVVSLGRHPHTDWRGALRDDDVAVARAAAARLGVESLWDRPFAEISDGQRQRVLVARALAQEPTVLVLDEPTAFLDITGRVELIAALSTLAHTGGLAVLVSTHDLELSLSAADEVWLVNQGRMLSAPPTDLVGDPRFAAAFDSDLVRYDRTTGRFIAAGGTAVAELPS